MVVYQKAHLRVAELHFDEPAPRAACDVIRYQYRTAPIAGGPTADLFTLWIDLKQERDALLAGMQKDARYNIRRAEKEAPAYEFQTSPSAEWAIEFFEFYDRFAESKALPAANRTRLSALISHGALDLSRMRGASGAVLVWHAYIRGEDRVRLLHSASAFRSMDREAAGAVGRANRLQHWADMLRFRAEGIATYDLGGWYAGSEDADKLRINDFKKSFGGVVVPQYNADRAGTWKGAAALRLHAAIQSLRGRED